MELENLLNKYFGHTRFRNGQQEIVESILNQRDALVVMPTGGGKSVCFQLPALLLPGAAIVISPLIALMKDQVDSLTKIGIPATYINSSLPYHEIQNRMDKIMSGAYKLIYIAPERLAKKSFINFLLGIGLSFAAVDEAHCISEWGHDFRPAYLQIPDALQSIKINSVIALTATATPEVSEDIIRSLKMLRPNRFIRGFDRPNLSYLSVETDSKIEKIIDLCKETKEGSTIVYCGSRKKAELFAGDLRACKLRAETYHAGLKVMVRKIAQDNFINGKSNIIVATNAFGMGIDKPDVRNVVHTDLTQSLEAYYQEAGRAGRDGLEAKCTMLYNSGDRKLQEYFIRTSHPSLEQIELAYNAIFDYCEINDGAKPLDSHNIPIYQIAAKASLPANIISSVIGIFERFGLMKKNFGKQTAQIHFTTTKGRIREYYNNTNDKRRQALDAILRSVSSDAFSKPDDINISNLAYKHGIDEKDIFDSLEAMQFAHLINYDPGGQSGGHTFLLERMPLNRLPIDFEAMEKRKIMAYKKLDVVERYARTKECKRNYILKYFRSDEVGGRCGRCSSCTAGIRVQSIKVQSIKVQSIKYPSKSKFLEAQILSAATELNGRFGISLLTDYLKGSSTKKIKSYKLSKGKFYGIAKEFSKVEIKKSVDTALSKGYLFRSSGLYPIIRISKEGKQRINAPAIATAAPSHSADSDVYSELLIRLGDLRRVISDRNGIKPGSLIGNEPLRQMALTLPATVSQLASIDAVSTQFVNDYADLFAEVIRSFIAEENIGVKAKLSKLTLEIVSKANRNETIESISRSLSLSKYAIAGHIRSALNSGIKIDRNTLIDDDVYCYVRNYIVDNPYAPLREIRQHIGSNIDMADLLICTCFVRNEIKRRNLRN